MITVSELNEQIKTLLEATFLHILVEGEVTNVTYHSSGHLYFSIKDDKSSIRAVMWRSNVKKMKFKIENGDHIIIDGSIGVYTPRGEYQIIAVSIEPFGKGALSVAFEQLKKKLEAKGYFDKERKKQIVKFPKKIAIVTSLKGAALQDMLKVAKKRWPLVEIVAIDTLVQGQNAAAEIAKAIEFANSLCVDVIIVGRGGGSQEDLWAFNEEIVADAIYNSKIAIVSAVGHEVDFLISDFVADLRAPTPSAAMEMILPDINEMYYLLDSLNLTLEQTIKNRFKNYSDKLIHLNKQLQSLSPKEKLKFYYNEFKSLNSNLNEIINHKFLIFASKLEPLINRINEVMNLILNNKKSDLKNILEQIKFNNPDNKIKEGFVEVVKDGKRFNICNSKLDDNLILQNSKCQIEVKTVKKRLLK